eukprot:CAMPEP_0119301660 /NCGR_PEP_ID=MMETSP1333-20130426/3400_1 /TAXON_ID=418940 /ORGANISM="Scyphosphaera apsteinii, Strain RCC1455" /LENGTH=353 /DNA_ID=CAMNT_0007303791 /DNA_START=138 /DNA_END=1199 /DNA_ORIENTATION=+
MLVFAGFIFTRPHSGHAIRDACGNCSFQWVLHIPKTGGTDLSNKLTSTGRYQGASIYVQFHMSVDGLPGPALTDSSGAVQIDSTGSTKVSLAKIIDAAVRRREPKIRRDALAQGQRYADWLTAGSISAASIETSLRQVLRSLGQLPRATPPVAHSIVTVLRRPADWLRSALNHIAMERGGPNIRAFTFANLRDILTKQVWVWFRYANMQAGMALVPSKMLPPGVTMTMYTVESGLVWDALQLPRPAVKGANSCRQFITYCGPAQWPGDVRNATTCARTPMQVKQDCTHFLNLAVRVVESPEGKGYLKTRCDVDQQLWSYVDRAGGALELGPWADPLVASLPRPDRRALNNGLT